MMMQQRPGQQQRGPMGGPMGHGPMGAMMPGAKARDFKGTMRKLIEYLGAYRLPILIVLIFAIASTATNIAYRFRRDISENINRMPLKYFDTTTHVEVLSRITSDVDTVNQTLSQSMTQI